MKNYLSCRIGNEWFGVSIENVLEVLHLVALNDVPGNNLIGVMTLREQVIPVIDLRPLFDVQVAKFNLDTPIIAIHYEGHKLGLIVDEADDVFQIPEELTGTVHAEGIKMMTRVEERMIFVLDLPFVIRSYAVGETGLK